MRCISVPICGRRLPCWSVSPASRSDSNGRTPPRRSWLRSSSCSPAGGSAAAPSTRCSTPRLPASPNRSRASRGACPGVVAIDGVRVRQVGPDQFVELNVSVSRTMPLDRVAALKEAVIKAVCAELPKAQISVVTEPRALDNETIMERVMVIARNRGLAVHHVTVHAIGEKLSVSLDLEVDGSLTLGAAHDIADGLETRDHRRTWRRCRGRNPYRAAAIRRASATTRAAARIAEVQSALSEIAARAGHALRRPRRPGARNARRRDHQFPLPGRSVENRARRAREGRRSGARACARKWPSIKRVIGHAEPLPRRQRKLKWLVLDAAKPQGQ